MGVQSSDTELQAAHEDAIDEATDGVDFHAWIDGESREAESGDTFETLDPATDIPITSVPQCWKRDVDAAVTAAREAFENEWEDTTAEERSRLLLDWIDELEDHIDELGLLESLDVGKPIENAKWEVDRSLDFLEYYATAIRGEEAEHVPAETDIHLYTRHEPYGVVGQITPWNYPMLLAAWKLGPALATGNATVLKPAPQSPLTTTRIAQLSAGILPDGVLNVVHGVVRRQVRP
jgi:aldehyde dehydrogenase (NAD+)